MPALEWYIEICIFLLNFWLIRCEDSGSFWHITDIHVDHNYSRFGNKENLCHEEGTPNGINKTDNGLYGNILCDTPWLLLNLTVASMYSIRKSVDFIIWTGLVRARIYTISDYYKSTFINIAFC
ncbi:hypothetical protein AVEN_172587-1 [Araneus ventricosus]|uniref:Uncharacterized protein n=1 Tax=Araneus ventricosus TaxID=182803 RepID=A0A4Y2SDS3_ARAVE|nr:hypothetical protein AVEN_196930-1 [Araneus ventricosus]GBN85436.1 hypothetical protein AVEN_172587-1 [Araneus ventricosus]